MGQIKDWSNTWYSVILDPHTCQICYFIAHLTQQLYYTSHLLTCVRGGRTK